MFGVVPRRLFQRGFQCGFHTMRGTFAAATTTDSAVSTTPQFKWQHLSTPLSGPAFGEFYKMLEDGFTYLRGELAGVPKQIDPINWSEWESKIQDKDVIQKIRQEYESLEFEQKAKKLPETFTDTIHLLEYRANKLEDSKSYIQKELEHCRIQLAEAEEEKVSIHHWDFHDWMDRYPGLAEQMREEYMEGYQLPSDAEDRLAELDFGELKKQVMRGETIPIEDELPRKFGTWDYDEEFDKVAAEVKTLFGEVDEVWPDFVEALEKERGPRPTTAESHTEQQQEQHH